MERSILLFIIIAGSLIFLLSLCKNKVESIATFVLRALMGFIGIYIVNRILEYMESSVMVGMNAATIGFTGLLGLPGFILLYALSYMFLNG